MLRLENISKYYQDDKNVTLALRKINLSFNIGEFVAITGESGSGKSTLLNVISGIDSYQEGEMYVNNEETSYYDDNEWEEYRKNYIAFIFQNYNLVDSYSVYENVLAAMIINGVNKKERRAKALEIIDKVGLSKHKNHKASKLSGGQKQRLSIARALAKDTPIIVADEPTGNLDSENGKQIIKLLQNISKDKLVIVVTHNYEEIEPYITRKIRIYEGQVVEDEVILSTNESFVNIDIKKTKSNTFLKALNFSLLNLKNQPKKTTLFLFICVISTVIISLIFSFYLFNVNQKYEYSSNYYFAQYKERIVLKNKNGEELTQADYDKIKKINNVKYVIKNELTIDLMAGVNKVNWDYDESSNIYGSYIYLPVSTISEKDLKIGRLPKNDNEIVISDNSYGEKLNENVFNKDYIIHNYSNINTFPYSNETYKIVGVTKKDNGFIFINDDTFKSYHQLLYFLNFNNESKFYVTFNQSESNLNINVLLSVRNVKINQELEGNKIRVSDNLVAELDKSKILEFYNYKDDKVTLELDSYIESSKEEGYLNCIELSKEMYNSIMEVPDYQYSVIVDDFSNVNTVLKQLNNNGYIAINPYLLGLQTQDIQSLMQNIFSMITSIVMIFICYILTYFVLRIFLLSKMRDYAILRSIGLDKKTIRVSTMFELLIAYVIASIITIIIIIFIKNLNFYDIGNLFSYYKWNNYITLFIINCFFSLLITLTFNRLVTKKSILANIKK